MCVTLNNFIVSTGICRPLIDLKDMKAKEAELKRKISFLSSVFAENESSADAFFKKIAELKLKLVANQKVLLDKETTIQILDSKTIHLLAIIDTWKRDRDCLRIHVRDADILVRQARETANALQEQVNDANQELAVTRDSDMIDLRKEALKNKKRAFVGATAIVLQSVKFREEVEEDLVRIDEKLPLDESAYTKTLEQVQKEKLELENVSRDQNLTEKVSNCVM